MLRFFFDRVTLTIRFLRVIQNLGKFIEQMREKRWEVWAIDGELEIEKHSIPDLETSTGTHNWV